MILPDNRTVLGLDAFVCNTRSDNFGQAVDVDCVDAGSLLNLLAHPMGPRFSAEDADF